MIKKKKLEDNVRGNFGFAVCFCFYTSIVLILVQSPLNEFSYTYK